MKKKEKKNRMNLSQHNVSSIYPSHNLGTVTSGVYLATCHHELSYTHELKTR